MMSTVSFKSDEHLLVIVFTLDGEIVSLSIFLGKIKENAPLYIWRDAES